MEMGGEALSASIEIIKMLYETAHLYRNLRFINQRFMNKICMLITLKEHISKSNRMSNNDMINNYILDIAKKLNKMRNKVESVSNKGFIKRIFYVRGLNNLAEDISRSVEDMKFLLDIKRELDNSSKMDIGNIIIDNKAREFWEVNFGSENLFIQTNLFFSAIRLNTKLVSTEIDFLKKIINDDNDKYISAFEFQEWLDFFGDFDVVMRRTIDSLIDPGTGEPYIWYHKNVSKNLVKTLLKEYNFIVRKHTIQKGVFIVNLNWRNVLISIYIRNKDNRFVIERNPDINSLEHDFLNILDLDNTENLREIVSRIDNLLNPNKTTISVDWAQQRAEFVDTEIHTMPSNEMFDFIDNIPILGSIKEALPTTDRFMNAIQFWK
jgi:hypothetical protein